MARDNGATRLPPANQALRRVARIPVNAVCANMFRTHRSNGISLVAILAQAHAFVGRISPCQCEMVKRRDKKAKFARWCFYFPNDKYARTRKRILGKLIEAGNASVIFHDVSTCRVELVWQTAVTYDSAARLVRLAQEKDSSFEILGVPRGIAEDADPAADDVAKTSDTGGADEASSAPVEAGAPDEAGAPQTKKPRVAVWRRLRKKSAKPSHAVFPGDDADAAPAAGPETAPASRPEGQLAASAAAPQRATRATSAPQSLPCHLLSLKVETIIRRKRHMRAIEYDVNKYEVDWSNELGEGTYGTVFSGKECGVGGQRVAVKVFNGGPESERPTMADAEVRRYAALPTNPYIVKLLDVCLFPISGVKQHEIGLVFEHFDTDLRKFLKIVQMKIAGMRHVLRSVLAALRFLHDLGLVHADCKPANILLRGAGGFKDGWLQLLGGAMRGGPESDGTAASASGVASTGDGASVKWAPSEEATHQLPALFEVRAVVHSLRTHARCCIRTDVSPNDGPKHFPNLVFPELSLRRPIRNMGMSKWV